MIESMNLVPVVEEVSTKLRRETSRWWPFWLVAGFIAMAIVAISFIQVRDLDNRTQKALEAIDRIRAQIGTNREMATQIATMKTRHDEGLHEIVAIRPLLATSVAIDLVERTQRQVELEALKIEPDDVLGTMRLTIRGVAIDRQAIDALRSQIEQDSRILHAEFKEPSSLENHGSRLAFEVEFQIRVASRRGEAT